MDKNLTFEQANTQLEETVKQLENDNMSLSQSVELYAKACELLGFCMNQIETSKGKIEDINERLERIRNGEADFNEQ